jgi:RNA polymerase sigma-70 factor (ECF subfamily)
MLQETLLAAWRGLPRFEGRSSLRSWLYRIATNTCLNAMRSTGRRFRPSRHHHSSRRNRPGATRSGGCSPIRIACWTASRTPLPGPDARYSQTEAIELAFRGWLTADAATAGCNCSAA